MIASGFYRLQPIALALVAGILFTLALKPFGIWPLAIIAAALLYTSIKQCDLIDNNRRLVFFALLFTFSFSLFLSGASWVYVSIHDFGYTSISLALILTILFCVLLATVNSLIWMIWPIVVPAKNEQNQHFHKTLQILLFASVATLTESMRTFVLTGFPWLFAGYSQTESLLAGWAPIVGVYGISFMLYTSGGVLSELVGRLRNGDFLSTCKSLQWSLILTTIIWLGGPLLNHVEWTDTLPKPYRTALIQTNISQHEKWRPEMRARSMALYQSMSEQEWPHSDIVVWPEAAIPAEYHQANVFFKQIHAIAAAHHSALISGVPYRDQTPPGEKSYTYNSVVALGKAEGKYHKQHLVPFGEYVPLDSIVGPLMAIFQLPLSQMGSGKENQTPLTILNWQSLPLICYEIVYPTLTARAAALSDVLITVSNDAWFGQSIGPLQHLQMAQMRALENGRYLIRATGTGVSAIIDNRGKIIAKSDQFKRQVLRGEVYLSTGHTPWTRFGYWLIHGLIASPLLIWVGWRVRLNAFRSNI